MNWFDIVILAVVIAGVVQGMRMGLLGAGVNAIALIIGWQLAGQLSDDIGGLFKGSISNDTIVTVISYIIIMALSVVVAQMAWKIIKPILTVATLGIAGMVDKVGGIAIGLIMGIVIAGALILVMARFTYNFELPDEGITGAVAGQIPKVQDTKDSIEKALLDSTTVPVFIKIANAIPGNTLGFVPSDFGVSLDILESRLES